MTRGRGPLGGGGGGVRAVWEEMFSAREAELTDRDRGPP